MGGAAATGSVISSGASAQGRGGAQAGNGCVQGGPDEEER